MVRFFKSNAQAGTRNSLKYTIEQQKYILLDKISEYIKEYSEYGQKVGWAKSENLSRCQDYANQIYYSLSEAGAPLNSLVVTDPMS